MNKSEFQAPEPLTFTAPPELTPCRLDKLLTHLLNQYSRTFIKSLIDRGLVALATGATAKASSVIKAGDQLTVTIPQLTMLTPSEKQVDHLNVQVIYEHPDFLIISKPAGLITHAPSATSQATTLVDWLLTYCSSLQQVGQPERPGIVHRLDKDTSGLMIVPRTNQAHMRFTTLFKDRLIHKTYLAIVQGHPPREGQIDFRIGRHPTDGKMSHIAPHGRDAITNFTTLEYFIKDQLKYALVQAKPVTGRTHQIRVHCTGMGHPLVGDHLYGTKSPFIARHALHAHKIAFVWAGENYEFEAPLPEDMTLVLENLKNKS